MIGPLIPFVHLPELHLNSNPDGPSIKPFGTLVAIGVYLGSIVAVRHAKQRGLDVDKMNSFIFWVVGLGFVGGHVFDAIFYTPERLMTSPPVLGIPIPYVLQIWAGLSSFGGFLGAIIGAVSYKYSKKEQILPYVDTVCSAFPLAWVFGRSGCASVHDHPGKLSSAFYAVKSPLLGADGKTWENVLGSHENVNPGAWMNLPAGMGRLDLGFIEMVLTIPLALAFYLLWRQKPRAYGFFAGYMCIAYAPVRFILDFLRVGTGDNLGEADPRYGGLTPAQWACFGLVALGIYIVRLGKSYGPVPATYEEAQENARAALLEQEASEDDGDADADKPKKVKTSTKKKKKGKKKRAKVEVKAESKAEVEESEGATETESESESEPEGESEAEEKAEEKAEASSEPAAKSASDKPKKSDEKKSETAESGDDHA